MIGRDKDGGVVPGHLYHSAPSQGDAEVQWDALGLVKSGGPKVFWDHFWGTGERGCEL